MKKYFPLNPGLLAEGRTNHRFLSGIIVRAIHQIAGNLRQNIEVSDVVMIPKKQGGFVEQVVNAAKYCCESGINVLFVHTAADAAADDIVRKNKLNPAFAKLESADGAQYCKTMVPVVPVQAIEAWMLADPQALVRWVGAEVEVHKNPESLSDPKGWIGKAIEQAQASKVRRGRKCGIEELYQPLGTDSGLDLLRKLPSYRRFEDEIKAAFDTLGLK